MAATTKRKKKKNGTKKNGSRSKSCLDSSTDEFQRTIEECEADLDRTVNRLEGLVTLDEDSRKHSRGKLRDGEEAAMLSILDAADSRPDLFTEISDKDGGDDPERWQSEPTRRVLKNRAKLIAFAARLAEMQQSLSDSALYLAEKAKSVTQAAYPILKANAEVSASLKTKGAKAITFYGSAAKKGAKTSKRNRGKNPPKTGQ